MFLEVMNMFIILTVVMLSWVDTCVITSQIVYFMCLYCSNYHKLYFSEKYKLRIGESTYVCILFDAQFLDSEKLRLNLSSLTS